MDSNVERLLEAGEAEAALTVMLRLWRSGRAASRGDAIDRLSAHLERNIPAPTGPASQIDAAWNALYDTGTAIGMGVLVDTARDGTTTRFARASSASPSGSPTREPPASCAT